MDNLSNEGGACRYPQPLDGGANRPLNDKKEAVSYLPGTSCRIWYTQLDTSYPEHRHNALEIIFGESGYYVMEINGTPYEIHSGDIIIVPPGFSHTLCPQHGCTGFVYLLDIGILNKIKSAAAIMPMLAEPIYITEKNNPRLHTSVSVILGQMQKEYFSGNSMRELLIYSRILELMVGIWENSLEPKQELPHVRPDKRKEFNDRFNEILQYINQHYMDDLTIDNLSRQFGLSKYYFARLFKKYTRSTFCDHLTNQRIKAAEYLLIHPDMSITDIAYQTGFSSISTFSRVFKQKKNCTPSEYRRIYEH